MGMFDEIRCETTLPDGGTVEMIWFQTKSFPDPCLYRYVITKTGRLVDSLGNDLEPDGYILFYTSECDAASSSQKRMWREYRARFLNGQLHSITQVSENDVKGVYFGLASFRYFSAPPFMFGDHVTEKS